jgi:D-3-phosphoglycerate dehydrogenase / 2-oxoglutarate reductase
MKVYVLDPIYPDGVEILRQHADVVSWDDPCADQWPDDADGLIVRTTRIEAADLARAGRLKVIGKQGVGVENIDLDAARKFGVRVFNTAGVNAEAVAEMAMALALSVARRVTQTDRLLRAGEKVVRQNFHGRGFSGKTLGVIGMGHIGRKVAQKWRNAFEMKVLGFDPFASDDAWVQVDCERVAALDDLLPKVDLLSIHAPLTDATRRLIGSAQLAQMKETAILVSAARGGIVDEAALYEAISKGQLYGAALDVFETEPPPADHPLLSLPTFVATPHIGGGTIETQELNAKTVAEGLLGALRGELPLTMVV